jgi:2-(1,2-epoxy-1,2-dihydrophenyl)acetyl-CoA isomerase
VKQVGSGTIQLNQRGALTELTLNRPASLNAISRQMADEFQRLLDNVRADQSCRCLIITGAGRGFCSGQALDGGAESGALPTDIAGLVRSAYIPIIERIRTLPLPVIAAVNGVAAGAGFSLALAADLRVASDNAWFSCGFCRIGLVPDSGATWFLPRIVGQGRALELALTGRRVDADEALTWGIVNKVFPAAEFEKSYREYALELVAGPTRALGLTKRAFNAGCDNTLEQQLGVEAELQQLAAGTSDFAEGIRAFQEKRPPTFTGL